MRCVREDSDRDLRAKLDDAIDRNREEVGRIRRLPRASCQGSGAPRRRGPVASLTGAACWSKIPAAGRQSKSVIDRRLKSNNYKS
jgi:hypothetical protein